MTAAMIVAWNLILFTILGVLPPVVLYTRRNISTPEKLNDSRFARPTSLPSLTKAITDIFRSRRPLNQLNDYEMKRAVNKNMSSMNCTLSVLEKDWKKFSNEGIAVRFLIKVNEKPQWNWVWVPSTVVEEVRDFLWFSAVNFTHNIILSPVLSPSATIDEVNVEMVSFPGTCFDSHITTDHQRRYMIASALLYQVTIENGTVCHLLTDAWISTFIGKKNSYCCAVMADDTVKCEHELVWNWAFGFINIIFTILLIIVIFYAPVLFVLSLPRAPYDYLESGVKLVRPDTPANLALDWWLLQNIRGAKVGGVVFKFIVIPGLAIIAIILLYILIMFSNFSRLSLNIGLIYLWIIQVVSFIFSVLISLVTLRDRLGQKIDITYLEFIKEFINPLFLILKNVNKITGKMRSEKDLLLFCWAQFKLLNQPCCWKFLKSSEIWKPIKVIIFLLLNLLYFTGIIALQILILVLIICIYSFYLMTIFPTSVWVSATACWIALELHLPMKLRVKNKVRLWYFVNSLCFWVIGNVFTLIVISYLSQMVYMFIAMLKSVDSLLPFLLFFLIFVESVFSHYHSIKREYQELLALIFKIVLKEYQSGSKDIHKEQNDQNGNENNRNYQNNGSDPINEQTQRGSPENDQEERHGQINSESGQSEQNDSETHQNEQTGRNDSDESPEGNHNEQNRQDDPQARLSEGNGQNESENVEGDEHNRSILYFDENHVPRIPYDLIAAVHQQILPKRNTIVIAQIKTSCTLAFYTFIFTCILAFGIAWTGDSKTTVVIQSIVTLLAVILAKLKSLFSDHVAESQLKVIKIENRIEDIIRKYKKGPGQNQNRNTRTSQDDNGRNHQNGSDRSQVEQNEYSNPQNSKNELAMQNYSGTDQNNQLISFSQFTERNGYSRLPGGSDGYVHDTF